MYDVGSMAISQANGNFDSMVGATDYTKENTFEPAGHPFTNGCQRRVSTCLTEKGKKKEGRKTHVLHGQETIKGTKDPWKDDSKDPLSGKSIVSIRIWTRKQDGF